ncbi:hypothetical protein PHISCL_10727, partial [Aspergillus sclerotialis]
MMLLSVKVDAALSSSCLTDTGKYVVRLQRQCFFRTFPPERVWLYVKISQNLNKFCSDDFTIQLAGLVLDGVEDKFAK